MQQKKIRIHRFQNHTVAHSPMATPYFQYYSFARFSEFKYASRYSLPTLGNLPALEHGGPSGHLDAMLTAVQKSNLQ